MHMSDWSPDVCSSDLYKVLMAFPAGNHDPEMFEDADRFIIDRAKNRHFAFGSGIHRCLGSNFARMEIKVALEVLLERIPTFQLSDPDAVTWTGGQVRGPRRVPIPFCSPAQKGVATRERSEKRMV